MSNRKVYWSETERDLIDGILDQIVPPSRDGRVPGAGALGMADYLGVMAKDDADFEKMLADGMIFAASQARSADKAARTLNQEVLMGLVKQLEIERPVFFQALLRHTYMGYYSRSDIRPLFGLSTTGTQPQGYDVTGDDPDLMEALLKPVKERGPCYRIVDPGEGRSS